MFMYGENNKYFRVMILFFIFLREDGIIIELKFFEKFLEEI